MKFFILTLISLNLYASGDHHHAEPVTLTDKAIKNFGIVCAPYNKQTFPSSAIVRSLNESRVYQCSKGSFIPEHADEIHDGEMVVIKGANFIKTVELSIEEGPAEGHGH
ncbi:MAG: hypothetical protein V4598_00360 [Bdellovibrionota bacterium]